VVPTGIISFFSRQSAVGSR